MTNLVPRVSIITVAYNAQETIERTIRSVLSQTYPDIEYIVVDGSSTDKTREIVKSYQNRIAKYLSEPDKGMYDAMNKGISLSSGEIIGFLNADDFYSHRAVIETVVRRITALNVDACYGDLVYVDSRNTKKAIRRWVSCPYREGLFMQGWHPPHPTFFVKKDIYRSYGQFDLRYPIASDYEIMYRFLEKQKISTCYIPDTLVMMRTGGFSNRSIVNIFRQNLAIVQILRDHHVRVPISFFVTKIVDRINQFCAAAKSKTVQK